jgi:hypothetical protein
MQLDHLKPHASQTRSHIRGIVDGVAQRADTVGGDGYLVIALLAQPSFAQDSRLLGVLPAVGLHPRTAGDSAEKIAEDDDRSHG